MKKTTVEDLVLWQRFMGWCHETGKRPGFGSSVNEFLEIQRTKDSTGE